MPLQEPESGPSWDERSRLPEFAGVLDAGDPGGAKNRLIDSVHKLALRRELGQVRGRRALDVGCGNGRISSWLAGRGADVAGVDPSQEMLSAARDLSPQVEFLLGDAEQLPFEGESFDVVVSVTVLQYLAQQPERLSTAAAEIARVLRANGRFVAIEQVHDGGLSRGASVGTYDACLAAAGLVTRRTTRIRLGSSRLLPHFAAHPRLVPLLVAARASMLEARLSRGRVEGGRYAEQLFVCGRS
jgi:ubiquinone/menaquinone biosynthesis C-methylase UbiE